MTGFLRNIGGRQNNSPKAKFQERCHCGKNGILDTKMLPIVVKQEFSDVIHREWPENPSGSVSRGLQSY